MQGSELCLKAQHMAFFQGHGTLMKPLPHLRTYGVCFLIETAFAQLIYKREKSALARAALNILIQGVRHRSHLNNGCPRQ